MPPLILASASPRRQELLKTLGLSFEVIPADIDEESACPAGLSPAETVEHLSRLKAKAIARDYPDHRVIGADTLVVLGETVLGKPKDREDAFRMLSMLQGQVHEVVSGIAVYHQDRHVSGHRKTRVSMNALTPTQIHRYIDTGEPMDKAGAYAIQGHGSVIIEGIEGCYFNVVGMSLHLLNTLLDELGYPLL